MVSGIIALALSVRPDLTMEQIREALVYTAVPINTRDPTWIRNDVGLMYSYKFGFGKIDATAFVQYAIKMKKLDRRPPGVRSLPRKIVLKESHQFSDETTIDENLFKMAKLGDIYRLEHVTVMMNIECPLRGELKIYIQSPCGTRILLASRRPLDDSSEGLKDWTMMTPGFWGEKINGTWTFILKYRGPGYATLIDYRMAFWGPLKAGINNQNFVDDLVNQYYPPTKDFFDFELAINSPAKGFDRREMVSINRSFDSDGYQDDRLVGEDFYAAVFTIISAAYLWIYPKFLFK